jgi:hypothetical protein
MSQTDALWPYLIVPALLLLVGLDRTSLGGVLQESLPANPQQILLYALIFGFPHIVGSYGSLVDRQYIRHYKSHLLKGSVVALMVAIAVVKALPISAGALIFNTLTAYHTIGQQSGIARAFLRTGNTLYPYWRHCVTAVACLLPTYMATHLGLLPNEYIGALHLVLMLLSAASLGLALLISWQHRRVSGWQHMASTQALLLSCIFFVDSGYPALTFMAPQVVHDITAFTIYIKHDRARALSTANSSNLLYRLLAPAPGHILWLLPVLSIAIGAMLVQAGLDVVVVWMTMGHYLFEASLWKRGSLHRMYLQFNN